jgi:hypothetical protein
MPDMGGERKRLAGAQHGWVLTTHRHRCRLTGLLFPFTDPGCAEGDCEALRPPLTHLDGRTYAAGLGSVDLAGDEIGAVVFTVSSDRSTAISSCGRAPVDGDSSLPVGTEFHSIIGRDPTDELAATFEGRFIHFSV